MPLSEIVAAFEAELTQRIRSGELKLHERLPSTAEIAADVGIPLRAVQGVLTRLAAQGLVERTPKRGTFVSHKAHTLLFVAGWNLDLEPCYMPRQLVHHLREAAEVRGMRLEVIHDLYSGMVNDAVVFKNFSDRLRGRIEAIDPAGVLEFQINLSRFSHVYTAFPLPSVHYGRPECGSDIGINGRAFLHDALAHLASVGCRSVTLLRQSALLTPTGYLDQSFWSGIKQHKFTGEILEVFREPATESTEAIAQNLAEMWIDGWRELPKRKRPDSLIVADDILLRGVARALIKKGISIPEELEVVYLAHTEITHQYGINATRYEVSIKEQADTMLELLLSKLGRQPLPKLPILVGGKIARPDATPPPSERLQLPINPILY